MSNLRRYSSISDISDRRQNQLVNTSRYSIREKPSFLRFVARTCNDISRTCRGVMDSSQTQSHRSVVPRHRHRDSKFLENTYESIFEEKYNDKVNDAVPNSNNPKEYLNSRIGIEQYDIAMMENYRKSEPFIIITHNAKCVVCGRILCQKPMCLASFGCHGCTTRVYCSEVCFGMDWPSHIKYCKAGEAEFLIRFLFNRINYQTHLSNYLFSVAEEGLKNIGRGAIVIVFEQIEAIKIFLKFNHDFNLEYYYSIQFVSVTDIDERFRGYRSYSLFSTIAKSYNVDTQITIIVMIKNNVPSVLSAENEQPFTGITVIRRQNPCQQQVMGWNIDNIIQDNRKHFDTLLSTTQMDFRSRRTVCLTFKRLNYLFGQRDDQLMKWRDILEKYFLKGQFILKYDNYDNRHCNNQDSESSYRSSID